MAEIAGERFRANSPANIEQELSGERNASRLSFVRHDVGVQHAELIDDQTSDVGEQRKVDGVGGRELGEHLDRVGSDCCDLNACRPQRGDVRVQLDELIAAIRSPIGGTGEHQEKTLGTHEVGTCSLYADVID